MLPLAPPLPRLQSPPWSRAFVSWQWRVMSEAAPEQSCAVKWASVGCGVLGGGGLRWGGMGSQEAVVMFPVSSDRDLGPGGKEQGGGGIQGQMHAPSCIPMTWERDQDSRGGGWPHVVQNLPLGPSRPSRWITSSCGKWELTARAPSTPISGVPALRTRPWGA